MRIETGMDNPALRAPSLPVGPREFSKFRKLAGDMVLYVRHPDHGSCGLAAPQIGVHKRIVAVSLMRAWDDEEFPTIALFNPQIVATGDDLETDREGCLSLPGACGLVTRPRTVTVRWQDADGTARRRSFSGVTARIVQHEIDHLDGVLFMDKAVPAEPLPRAS